MACEPGRHVTDFKAAVGKCVTFTLKLNKGEEPIRYGEPMVVKSVSSDGHVHFVTGSDIMALVDTEHHHYYTVNGWPVVGNEMHKNWIYVDPSKCTRAFDYLKVVREFEEIRDLKIKKAQNKYVDKVLDEIKKINGV